MAAMEVVVDGAQLRVGLDGPAARPRHRPRGEALEPDPELRSVYDDLHRRHRKLYSALRPLFNGGG